MTEPYDWKIDVTYEASSYGRNCGGQQISVTCTGVKATHITGLSAYCNSERSQYKNKEIALQMLEYGLILAGHI